MADRQISVYRVAYELSIPITTVYEITSTQIEQYGPSYGCNSGRRNTDRDFIKINLYTALLLQYLVFC